MIRTALIGVTGYGRYYLSQLMRLQKSGKLKLNSLVIINPEDAISGLDFPDSQEIAIYHNAEDLFKYKNEDIDLCCIPTGISSHTRLAVKAMEAGAHILLEKPIAGSVKDVMAIQNASEKSGKRVMIGFQHLYLEMFHKLKKELLNGRIGKIKTVKIIGNWPRGFEYFSRNEWVGRQMLGTTWVLDSPANNAFAHYINLCLFLVGDKQMVSGETSKVEAELYRVYNIENYDTVAMKVHLKSGVVIYGYLSHCGDETIEPQIIINGEQGNVQISNEFIRLKDKNGIEDINGEIKDASIRQNMFDVVVEVLQGEERNICSLDIAMAHTYLINALYECNQIQSINTKYIVSENGFSKIPGLSETFRKCFDQCCLPSEIGAGWSVKPARFDCNGYEGIGI